MFVPYYDISDVQRCELSTINNNKKRHFLLSNFYSAAMF